MNMQSIMAQAQRMQKDIQKKKEELDKQLFPGKYEFVEITMNGKKEIVKCKINKNNLSNEEIEMLEDFIVLASKDAITKIDKEFNSKMGQYSGMLNGLI